MPRPASIRQVAERIGRNYSAVSSFERGAILVGDDFIRSYATATGIPEPAVRSAYWHQVRQHAHRVLSHAERMLREPATRRSRAS